MDLQTISSQMRVVIQKHQMVVTEMRNDPQNPVLQKTLNDLQMEIHSLNERQKQVIEGIRKNFGKKSNCPSPASTNSSDFLPTAASPGPQPPNQEMRMLCCASKYPVANHKIAPAGPGAKCGLLAFRAPLVLPPGDPKVHPLLVVPSPSNRCTPEGVQLLNLVPPIRVPQYPPSTRPNCQKPRVVNNNCIAPSMNSQSSSNAQSLSSNGEPTSGVTTSSSPESTCEKYPPAPTPEKINHKIDQKKKEFIKALGLVTRDSLEDIRSKKLERKRRSTANPQFSNAALEEKLRNAAAAPPQKRPRGRPRLEKPVTCPSNGVCSPTEKPKTPPPPTDTTSAISSSSSPLSDAAPVPNGIQRLPSTPEEGKNVEQMLSGLCMVCTQPGDLVKCDSCAKQQHLSCMQPPLLNRPQGPWQCPECQSRAFTINVVQSYDMLKAAKEDEKRKLLKKSLELRLKRSQLEGRLLQLKELSGKQKSRQSDLQSSLKGAETSLERLHGVINSVRLCS